MFRMEVYSSIFEPISPMILQQSSAEITYGSLNRELDVQVASAWTEEVEQSSASSWVLSMDQTQEVSQQLPTVDGWNPAPVEVGSLSHYLQGFIHPPGGVRFQPSVVTLTM